MEFRKFISKFFTSEEEVSLDNIINDINKGNLSKYNVIGKGMFSTVYSLGKFAIKNPSTKYIGYKNEDYNNLKDLQSVNCVPRLYAEVNGYLITERIKGVTLSNLAGYELKRLCYKYQEALHQIFKNGYIPYDCHAGNIMVDENDRLYVVDVGLFQKRKYTNDERRIFDNLLNKYVNEIFMD